MAIASIDGYQKYISPRKGFSCAHRHLYGGESCSQYIKQLVAEEGLFAAVRASRQRFAACREANQTLRALASSSPPPDSPEPDDLPPDDLPPEDPKPDELPTDDPPPKNPQPKSPPLKNPQPKSPPPKSCLPQSKKRAKPQPNQNCDDGACAEAACEAPFYCMPEDCSLWETADCSPDIDCSGADCSGADCSGADCSGADCGSCF